MNKRQRKKQLKKTDTYVSDSELWDFDSTICKWMIPKLKRFKQINIAYPGNEECPTPEEWDNILDKIIKGFELASIDPLDLYGYEISKNPEAYKKCYEEWNKEKTEGLMLFAKWFNYLWI